MSSSDEIIKSIITFLQYMRSAPSTDRLELEFRVGEFMTDQSFVSGYDAKHIDVTKRIRAALIDATKLNPQRWKLTEGSQHSVKHMYGPVRRISYTTTDADGKKKVVREVVQHKQRVSSLDVYTDRPYHLRCRLSRETDVKDPIDLSKIPDSVQVVQRMSVQEFVPMGSSSDGGLVVQWDISKVTPSSSNKKEACDLPCRYHCELELITQLHKLDDPELEANQDSFIARSLVERASWLLGTHSGTTPLPPPKLIVFKR